MQQLRQQIAMGLSDWFHPVPTFGYHSGPLWITFSEANCPVGRQRRQWRRPNTAAWSGDQMTPLGLACRVLTDGGQFPGCDGARKVHGESTEHLCAPHGLNVLRGTFLALYRPWLNMATELQPAWSANWRHPVRSENTPPAPEVQVKYLCMGLCLLPLLISLSF